MRPQADLRFDVGGRQVDQEACERTSLHPVHLKPILENFPNFRHALAFNLGIFAEQLECSDHAPSGRRNLPIRRDEWQARRVLGAGYGPQRGQAEIVRQVLHEPSQLFHVVSGGSGAVSLREVREEKPARKCTLFLLLGELVLCGLDTGWVPAPGSFKDVHDQKELYITLSLKPL